MVAVAKGIEGECVCPNQQVSCSFPLRGCLRLRRWAFQREGVREEVAPCLEGQGNSQTEGLSVGRLVGRFSCTVRVLFASVRTGAPRKPFHTAECGMPESAFTMQLSRSSGKESRSNRGRLRRLAVSPVIAYGRRGGFFVCGVGSCTPWL